MRPGLRRDLAIILASWGVSVLFQTDLSTKPEDVFLEWSPHAPQHPDSLELSPLSCSDHDSKPEWSLGGMQALWEHIWPEEDWSTQGSPTAICALMEHLHESE